MKLQTTFLFFFFMTALASAQIPGGNFESWQSVTFEFPEYADWTVYQENPSPESQGLLEKSDDASDGNFAIKFNTFGTKDFGYVVYGQVAEEGPSGGIPFADDPTQFTISYKCNMASGDSAQIWLWLYSGGNQITNDSFKLGGTQLVFKDTTFNLSTYAEAPDSMMFGLIPCNPWIDEIRTAGNEIYFDNVRFNGTNNLQLPDSSFESWTTLVQDYTEEMHNVEALSAKTDEAYNGNFALKMSTQKVSWEENENTIRMRAQIVLWAEKEYIQVSENDWEAKIHGGLPIHARKDTLVFYYKYTPAVGVIDTAAVNLKFQKSGSEVLGYYEWMLTTGTYAKFEIPFDLDNNWTGTSVDADSMFVELRSSKWRENWTPSDVNIEGSSLYIDYMYFKSQLYPQTSLAGPNGNVSPSDTALIKGSSITFTITPDNGFEIDSVTYNNIDISDELVQAGNVYTYAIDSVTGPGTLSADFKIVTGINNMSYTNDNMSIYPNPTCGILYIEGASKEDMVELISITGAVMYQKMISDNASVDISHIPDGIYFIKINNSIQGKIMKQ
jgi:hypothetical protein